MNILQPQVSNSLQPLLASDPSTRAGMAELNFKALTATWNVPDFEFNNIGKTISKRPDIWIVGGCIVFPSLMKNALFPAPCPDLEFLPINASGDEWLLVNCLKSSNGYDQKESILYRSLEGQIFMIDYLVMNDDSLRTHELFTLTDSNRATVFVLPSFADRVRSLGLKGLTFKEIGTLKG